VAKALNEPNISLANSVSSRPYINMTSELGFPRLDYKCVNDIMGLPISMVGYFSAVLVSGLSGVDDDVSNPLFRKSSR
jgi:hypothetical protein